MTAAVCSAHLRLLLRATPRKLKLLTLSTASPVDGGMSHNIFPELQEQLLSFADVEREVVLLTPLLQESHLLSVGRLIIVGDQDDGAGAVSASAVRFEQGVQQWAQNASLRPIRVENQGGGSVLANPYMLWSVGEEVQNPAAQVGTEFQPQ